MHDKIETEKYTGGQAEEKMHHFFAVNGYNPKWVMLMIPVLLKAWEENDLDAVDGLREDTLALGLGKNWEES